MLRDFLHRCRWATLPGLSKYSRGISVSILYRAKHWLDMPALPNRQCPAHSPMPMQQLPSGPELRSRCGMKITPSLDNAKQFLPPKRNWEWCINGDWHSIRFQMESSPCWFYRVTQRAILGIHWRRIK